MSPTMETLTGKVKRIHVRTDNFCVAELEPDCEVQAMQFNRNTPKHVMIKGKLMKLAIGLAIGVAGYWEINDPKCGWYLQVIFCWNERPSGKEQIIAYLTSDLFCNIGPKLAELIWNEFADDILSVLENEPARLQRIPGIGPKRAAEIGNAFKNSMKERELYFYLIQFGVSPEKIAKINAMYERPLEEIKGDPHKIGMEIGLNFKTCKAIAADVDSPINGRLYKNGTYFDDEGFSIDGFDRNGFDRHGRNRGGYDIRGYNDKGFDVFGYDVNGYNADGFNKDGYDKHCFDINGFDREGFDRNGYDQDGYGKDGYDSRGFDREGYDRQGFNERGEFVVNVLLNAEDGLIDDSFDELIERAGLKETYLNIENAKECLEHLDYIGAYAHIRLSSESFVRVILRYSSVVYEETDEQFAKLQVIEQYNLLSVDELKVLHIIRKLGNRALHQGDADAQQAPVLLEQYQTIVQNWTDKILISNIKKDNQFHKDKCYINL